MAKKKKGPVYRTVTVEVHDPDPNRMGFFGVGKDRSELLRKLTRKVCRVLEDGLPPNIEVHNVSIAVQRAERLTRGHKLNGELLGTATITFSEWFSEG